MYSKQQGRLQAKQCLNILNVFNAPIMKIDPIPVVRINMTKTFFDEKVTKWNTCLLIIQQWIM